ncbi:MAG: hypothetical protein U0930_21150 [Pirellulales bacterium]
MVEFQKIFVLVFGFLAYGICSWLFGFEWGLLGLLVGVLFGLFLGGAVDRRINGRTAESRTRVGQPASSPYMTFTMLRPGLKQDHYIPLRLRIVDSASIAIHLPVLILGIGVPFLWVRLIPPQLFGNNRLSQVVWFVLWAATLAVWTRALHVVFPKLAKYFFVLFGMLAKEEASSFPLRADQEHVDAWPESWQKPLNDE